MISASLHLPVSRSRVLPTAPATFLGWQDGCGVIPSFRIYNLTEPLDGHCAGSTVSEMTLLELGLALPDGATPKPPEVS